MKMEIFEQNLDEQGLYHGEMKKYYENGKVKVIEIYEHGMFISKKEF